MIKESRTSSISSSTRTKGIYSIQNYGEQSIDRLRKYKQNGMWGYKWIVDMRLASVSPEQREEIRLWNKNAERRNRSLREDFHHSRIDLEFLLPSPDFMLDDPGQE